MYVCKAGHMAIKKAKQGSRKDTIIFILTVIILFLLIIMYEIIKIAPSLMR